MARVGNFLNVTTIRGKLGGTVFTASKSGSTLRARIKPRNPKTTPQSYLRSALTSGTRAAISLSASDITLWKTYAATITKHNKTSGAAYHPAWNTTLNACYTTVLLAGGTPASPFVPPTSVYTPTTLNVSLGSPTAGDLVFTFSEATATDEVALLYVGLIPGTAQTATEKMTRFAGNFTPVTGTLTKTITGLESGKRYAVGYKLAKSTTGQQGSFTFLGELTVT